MSGLDLLAWDGAYTPFIHAADDLARPRPWEVPRRRLAHWLLVTSLQGGERIVVDDEAFAVPEGATYLIQPDRLHDLAGPHGSQPAWIHFDLRFDPRRREHPHAGPYDSELGVRRRFLQPDAQQVYGVDLPVLVPEALRAPFRDTVPRVIRTWQKHGRIDVLEAHHLLAGLLLMLVEHAWRGREGGEARDPAVRLARAEAAARRALDTGFGVTEFAAAAGYSRSRFCALFAAARGIAPGEWLRRERMRLAEQLLARRELPVARVGALVGYPDPTVFGRVFRAHTGRSPGAWRDGVRRPTSKAPLATPTEANARTPRAP